MSLRVTLQSFVNEALDQTRQQTDQLGKLQIQASTGSRLQAPSDDPAAAAVVQAGTAQSDRLQSYLGNISTVTGTLNQSVSTLQDVSSIVTQAKSIALQASQSTGDAASNSALADQVDQLLSRLLADANSQQNGEYLYAGGATQTQPFAVAGTDSQGNPTQVTYQGSAAEPGAVLTQNEAFSPYLDGQQVFQGTTPTGSYDAFQTLISLRDTLRNTSLSSHDQATAISGLVGDIDNVASGIDQATGKQAALVQNLSQLQTQLTNVQLSVQQTVSNAGDADPAQVVVQMQAQQTMLQLSLYGFSKLLNQSLLDFLK